MPIDPTIALQGRPAQIPGPMESYAQLLQLQQHQQQIAFQRENLKSLAEERQANAQKAQIDAQQKQRVQQSQQAIDGLMSNAMVQDNNGVYKFDRPTFEQGLIQSGQGHLYPQFMETLDKLEESQKKINGERNQSIARSLMAVQQAGNTPAAVQTAAAFLKKNNLIDDSHLQPVLEAVHQDESPENIGRVMQTLGAGMPEYQDLVNAETKRKREGEYTLGEGQVRYDQNGQLLAAGPPKTNSKLQGKWVADYDAQGKPIERWVADGPGAVAPRVEKASTGFTLAPGAIRYDEQGNQIAAAPLRPEKLQGKWIADYDANGKPIERWVEEGPGAVAPRQETPTRPIVVSPGAKVIDPNTGATVAEGNPQSARDAALARVETVNDAGQPVTKFVQPAAGLELPKPDPALTRPREVKPGSEEAFFIAYAKKLGKRPDDLSLDEQSKARQAWSRADDKPSTADDAAVNLSPAGIDAAATMYAKTGTLPPMGMGKPGALVRAKIINRAADMYPGLDLASNKAGFQADQGALTQLQKQRDAIGAFEQTAGKNIDVFLKAAGKVVDTGSPMANSLARMVSGKMLGSPDQAAYDAARQVAINEIAKITSNPNLSGSLSDSARHEVDAFNPNSATLKQTVAVMRLLKNDMQNRTTSMDEQLAAIRARIKGSGGSPSQAAPAAPAGPAALFSYQDYLKQKGK